MSEGWDLAKKGMRQAYDHVRKTDPGWIDAAREAIYRTALRCRYFIIDDVHDQLAAMGAAMPTAAHGCALGALMNEAKKNRWMVGTGEKRRSGRPLTHGDLRPVWRSLIFDPDAPLIPLVESTDPRMCRNCGNARWVEKGLCRVCRAKEVADELQRV